MLTIKACQKIIHNKKSEKDIINPLHPNTSMYILYTVLYFYGADEENLFTDQKLLLLVIISFILVTLMCDSGWYCREKLDANHSQGLKVSSVHTCKILWVESLLVTWASPSTICNSFVVFQKLADWSDKETPNGTKYPGWEIPEKSNIT